MDGARSTLAPGTEALPQAERPSFSRHILPPIDRPTAWHVSPTVDLSGYAFGWILLAAPIYLLLGSDLLRVSDSRPAGFWLLAIATLVLDGHRHFTFPYVYLDRRVRTRFPLRFFLLPAIIVALFTQMPFWNGSPRALDVTAVCAMGAWTLLIVQLLSEDGMGATRLSRTLRRAGIGAAGGALVGAGHSVASFGPVEPGWIWLWAAAGGSLLLTIQALNDEPAERSRVSTLLAPVAMGLAVATAMGSDTTLSVGTLVNVGIGVYAVWLLYHGVMQKYGILRMYSAKSGQSAKVPGWVDAALVWSWMPMVLVWSFASAPRVALQYLDSMSYGAGRFIAPAIGFANAHFALMMTLAAASIASALATFVYFEWKTHRLRNAPRLAFAAGTQLFYACVFLVGPVGWYVVGATTHGIEYVTFVWAFQRRRYPQVDSSAPLLSRLVQHPLLYYIGGSVVIAAAIFFARYAHSVLGVSLESMSFFGAQLATWSIWYSILQGIPHFYYDGFLWKMRQTELAKSL